MVSSNTTDTFGLCSMSLLSLHTPPFAHTILSPPPTLFQMALNGGRDHDTVELWLVIGTRGGAACCCDRIGREGVTNHRDSAIGNQHASCGATVGSRPPT